MKKREIVKQNIQLFTQLDSAVAEVEFLKKQLNETQEKLNAVTSELEELKSRSKSEENEENEPESAEPVKDASEPDIVAHHPEKVDEFKISLEEYAQQPELRDDLAYAADTIGKIVIESAKYSNKLTADGNPDCIELVNLILGKTEVSKSEILSVTREDIPLSVKKQKIDAVKTATIEYFDSVMAQRT